MANLSKALENIKNEMTKARLNLDVEKFMILKDLKCMVEQEIKKIIEKQLSEPIDIWDEVMADLEMLKELKKRIK